MYPLQGLGLQSVPIYLDPDGVLPIWLEASKRDWLWEFETDSDEEMQRIWDKCGTATLLYLEEAGGKYTRTLWICTRCKEDEGLTMI